MNTEKKKLEGDSLMQEGEKAIKTTLFKWKPEWNDGANAFEKAATCYKIAKRNDLAINAFRKAGECELKMQSIYKAAKHFETAAKLCFDEKKEEEGLELYRQCSQLFRENGNGDKGAEVLTKGGDLIKGTSPSTAIEFYLEAMDIYEVEGKERYCSDIFRSLLEIYVNLKKFDESIELLKKQIKFFLTLQQNHNVEKCIASIIIIHISREDAVSADKYFMEAGNIADFSMSEVGRSVNTLLQSYKERNDEIFGKCKQSNHLRYLDPPIVRLLRGIVLNGENGEDDLI